MTPEKFRAYVLQNDYRFTARSQTGSIHNPTQIRKVMKQESRVQTQRSNAAETRVTNQCITITGERARNNTKPQTKYARSQRYPVSIVTIYRSWYFSVTLTIHHSSGTEVLARRLIGTCTQMSLIRNSHSGGCRRFRGALVHNRRMSARSTIACYVAMA